VLDFGSDVTPNAHALAQNFVLFDNFYVDADVSYNGHAYSTAAYAADFIEKMWQTLYAGRGAFIWERAGIHAKPLWQHYCAARRVSLGLRAACEGQRPQLRRVRRARIQVASRRHHRDSGGSGAPRHRRAHLPGMGFEITDNKRIRHVVDEFRAFVAKGALPRLSIIRLPNDHTSGSRPGALTPRAMVADNDLALGRLVEADFAQHLLEGFRNFRRGGRRTERPDHVDSHRSILLVASPFAKRGFVDHSFYTTSGVLRTSSSFSGCRR